MIVLPAAAAREVLVGRAQQACAAGRRPAARRPRARAARDLGGDRSRRHRRAERRSVPAIDRGRRSAVEIEQQRARLVQVLAEVEAALALRRVLEAAIPVAAWIDVGGVVRDVQGRQAGVRRDARHAVGDLDVAVDGAVLVRGGVEIAERDQRPHLEPDRPAAPPSSAQRNDDGVLAVHQQHRLLERDPVDARRRRPETDRDGTLAGTEALRVDHAGILSWPTARSAARRRAASPRASRAAPCGPLAAAAPR